MSNNSQYRSSPKNDEVASVDERIQNGTFIPKGPTGPVGPAGVDGTKVDEPNAIKPTPAPVATEPTGEVKEYKVAVATYSLNYREEPNASSKIKGQLQSGEVHTIIAEKNGWGRLKSGLGWLNLEFTKKA